MIVAQADRAGVQPRVLLAVPGNVAGAHEVADLLREQRCTVVECHTMHDAVLRAGVVLPHLVVVSGQPLYDLLDACRAMRSTTVAHVLVLGRADAETEEVLCLEAGCDSYLGLPMSPRRLGAHVTALLRRAMVASPREVMQPIPLHGIRIDMQRRRVYRDGSEVMLSQKEFALLMFLAEHAGQIVTRQALSRFVWGTEAANDSRSLDVHIHWLREKLEIDARNPRHIRTVRGIGYCFEVSPDPA